VVENIRADVTSDNAVNAREKALAKARREAFQILSDRMLKGDALNQARDIDDLTISSLIKNFEIVREKLSSTRYIATISVTFDRAAIKSYFYSTGDKHTTSIRRSVMILPWFVVGEQAMIWQDSNIWMQAWRNMAEAGSSVVPFMLPLGDIIDIRDYAPASPFSQQGMALEALRLRYKVEDIFLVTAKPQGAQTVIQIFSTPQGTPRLLETMVITAEGSADMVYRRGVEQTLSYLRNDWKQKTALSSEMPYRTYNVTARFNGLQGWVTLRDLLQDIGGIEKIDVNAVSPQKADIEIYYRGDLQNLAMILDQYNIAMMQMPAPAVQNTQSFFQQMDSYGRLIQQTTQTPPKMLYEIYMKQNRF